MFRIGFDPMLEAVQRNEEVIREMDLIRMATQKSGNGKSKNTNSIKFLAVVGRSMASLGAILEERFGDQLKSRVDLDQSI